MPVPKLPDLSPSQVVDLKDALLENADRLLTSALAVLERGNTGLARSLAILGLEESGKAIAIHDRQVEIAYDDEGAPFVDERLRKVWGHHSEKLRLVHRFLVEERYWFDVSAPNPDENLALLGAIEEWASEHNQLKQRGFYVDVSPDGEVLAPSGDAETETVAEVIGRVHQIGWQLRLGEHIEAKGQAERERGVQPSTEAELEDVRAMFGDALDEEAMDDIIESMREGTPGTQYNNAGYRLRLPGPGSDPFANLGKPGYEAETREIARLAGPPPETETESGGSEEER